MNATLYTYQCRSSIRQGTLQVARSKKSNKGILRQIKQIQSRQSHYGTVKYKKMASEQISQNEIIMQAVAEATRVAIQTIATTSMARQENAGTKMNGPILKQPMFN